MEPQIINLTNFVEDEMILESNPLYLSDAFSRYIEQVPRSKRRRKINTFVSFSITHLFNF